MRERRRRGRRSARARASRARSRRSRRPARGTSPGATPPPRGRRAATCRRPAPGSPPATTRAPSCSSRSTYCSAARFSGSAASADGRRLGEQADREPAEPRLGHRRLGEHRPRERDVRDGSRHRADRVEASAPAGTRPRSGSRPSSASGRRALQQAAGRRIEQPVSVPSAEVAEPAASAAAFPPDEPPAVLPGCAGILRPSRTRGSGSSRPRRTRAGSPCRRRRRPRPRGARPPARSASGT